MILDVYQKVLNWGDYQGVEYMYLCGIDIDNPVGDFRLKCFPEVCTLDLRVYKNNKKSINILKECLIDVLEYIEEDFKYDLVTVPNVDDKLELFITEALENKRKSYRLDNVLPTGMPLYIIALSDNVTEESIERARG